MSLSTPDDSSSQEPEVQPGEGSSDSGATSDAPTEVTLSDGESVTFTAPADGSTHIVVNVSPPQRSTGFFSSCLQGCGCLALVVVVLAIIGTFSR